MDQTTLAVKNMYEQYPYPAGVPNMRAGFDARLLLSYVNQAPEKGAPLKVLDAGCGRGLGLIGAATMQPDVSFLGADINTVGLADAQQNAQARGLSNISFVQADLMTLEGIEIPPGGFDVIYSSGVLHHLSDPEVGLKNMQRLLAPHGVISLMIYGSYGRQPLYRLIEGIELLCPKEPSIEARMPAARLLAQAAEKSIFKGNYWEQTAQVNDVEFVDRSLNVNEVSYDIESLWQRLNDVGMKFVRWTEPEDWSIEKLFSDPQLLALLRALDDVEQYKIIERFFERPSLALVICNQTNEARAPIAEERISTATFAVNPEVSFMVEKRNLNQAQRVESLSYKINTREPQPVLEPSLAQAVLLLLDQTTGFSGKEMIQALGGKGVGESGARQTLCSLLEKEILYCPH